MTEPQQPTDPLSRSEYDDIVASVLETASNLIENTGDASYERAASAIREASAVMCRAETREWFARGAAVAVMKQLAVTPLDVELSAVAALRAAAVDHREKAVRQRRHERSERRDN